MSKPWKMFKHEYTRHVLRKRFIFALLSVPLWVLFSAGLGVLSVVLTLNHAPVGYVDQADLIKAQLPTENERSLTHVTFKAFTSETEARAALDAKTIQCYFVVPADYRDSLAPRLVYLKQPSAAVEQQIADLLRYNLLSKQSPAVAERVINGSGLVIKATHESSQGANNNWLKTVAPIVAEVFLIISVFTSSGYLMKAVVEEKENRTMEILTTTASPTAIMGSKILALICVGLTQVLVWSIFPVIALLLAAAYTPFLQNLSMDWNAMGMVAATALPTFLLIASLMATIGATITESSEGQQVSTLVTLPVMAPYMLMPIIVRNPNGPIAVFFSIFPLTSALTLSLRMGFATIPTWQIIVSIVILIASAVGSLWLAGRVFRMGMLRYGKRMGWKDVFQAMRPQRNLQRGPSAGKEAA